MWDLRDVNKIIKYHSSRSWKPFSSAIACPRLTEMLTAGWVRSNSLARDVALIPGFLTAQQQNRLPALTFSGYFPDAYIRSGATSKSSENLLESMERARAAEKIYYPNFHHLFGPFCPLFNRQVLKIVRLFLRVADFRSNKPNSNMRVIWNNSFFPRP